MLAMLQSKRDELNDLLQMKAQLQENLAEEAAAVKAPKEKAPPSPPKEKAPPSAGELKESELKAILMHRMQAQQAVDEQERKIAQLTALQEDLRARLSEMTAEEEEDEEEEEEAEEEAEAPGGG